MLFNNFPLKRFPSFGMNSFSFFPFLTKGDLISLFQVSRKQYCSLLSYYLDEIIRINYMSLINLSEIEKKPIFKKSAHLWNQAFIRILSLLISMSKFPEKSLNNNQEVFQLFNKFVQLDKKYVPSKMRGYIEMLISMINYKNEKIEESEFFNAWFKFFSLERLICYQSSWLDNQFFNLFHNLVHYDLQIELLLSLIEEGKIIVGFDIGTFQEINQPKISISFNQKLYHETFATYMITADDSKGFIARLLVKEPNLLALIVKKSILYLKNVENKIYDFHSYPVDGITFFHNHKSLAQNALLVSFTKLASYNISLFDKDDVSIICNQLHKLFDALSMEDVAGPVDESLVAGLSFLCELFKYPEYEDMVCSFIPEIAPKAHYCGFDDLHVSSKLLLDKLVDRYGKAFIKHQISDPFLFRAIYSDGSGDNLASLQKIS